MLPFLAALGIKPEVQHFFEPWLEVSSETELQFSYLDQAINRKKREVLNAHGSLIPSTTGIWCAGALHPNTVRHNFLFNSAIEVLSFCSMNIGWLARPGNVAFSALGLCPVASQVEALRSRFPNARLHTVFGNDVLGRIADCKVALWAKGKDADFHMHQDIIIAQYNSKSFRIPESIFSLHFFEKKSSLRAGIRTHKPKAGFVSFFELLKEAS